jgi:LCP family protein required for cell wall assembly
VTGGSRLLFLKRLAGTVGVLALVLVSAVATSSYLLYQRTEANLTRVELDGLDVPVAASDARHFLIVGSDDRSGLTDEEQRALTLGSDEEFGGQRSDTTMYVYISEDRSQVSVLSMPRDLIVRTPDGRRIEKLTDRFEGGPNAVIESLWANYRLPVNHYAEVSLGGFVDLVETLGGVTITLDEPLVDPKSGAEFTEPGRYAMSPTEALSYVRSRTGDQQGDHGDYVRITRQQTFIRAVLDELLDAGNLANPAQLFRLADDLSSNVTTDVGLGLEEIRFLADDLREVVAAGVPMSTYPSYSRMLPGSRTVFAGSYVLPYEPGARAIAEAVARGEPLPQRATREEAADVEVALWSGGRAAMATVVAPTLIYAGYEAQGAGSGPGELDAGERTVVYALPGHLDAAEKVAALLGTDARALPAGAIDAVREGIDVVVAVGDDASS